MHAEEGGELCVMSLFFYDPELLGLILSLALEDDGRLRLEKRGVWPDVCNVDLLFFINLLNI